MAKLFHTTVHRLHLAYQGRLVLPVITSVEALQSLPVDVAIVTAQHIGALHDTGTRQELLLKRYVLLAPLIQVTDNPAGILHIHIGKMGIVLTQPEQVQAAEIV